MHALRVKRNVPPELKSHLPIEEKEGCAEVIETEHRGAMRYDVVQTMMPVVPDEVGTQMAAA